MTVFIINERLIHDFWLITKMLQVFHFFGKFPVQLRTEIVFAFSLLSFSRGNQNQIVMRGFKSDNQSAGWFAGLGRFISCHCGPLKPFKLLHYGL